MKNVDFLLKNVDFIIKQPGEERSSGASSLSFIHLCPTFWLSFSLEFAHFTLTFIPICRHFWAHFSSLLGTLSELFGVFLVFCNLFLGAIPLCFNSELFILNTKSILFNAKFAPFCSICSILLRFYSISTPFSPALLAD